MVPTGVRQSAEERREAVLEAALLEFADGGLEGTSTAAIAARAGISQPYVFRLFASKKDLFIAVVRRMFQRLVEQFERAAGDATGQDALQAMGVAYCDLIADRTFLLLMLQAFAHCEDPEVRAVTRRGFRDLWYLVERVSGASPEEIQPFFAMGMLCNVVTAMDLRSVDERWAKLLVPEKKPDGQ
jgi:AcrR family transcriptional regulator